ncbi:hypothetical protein BCV71DRAFT_239352, partial [Rhizopus microsporus]
KELVVQHFQLRQANWRISQLSKLQDKWDRMLRQYKHYSILSLPLPSIETQIEFQRYIPASYHPESSNPCLDQANRQTATEYFYSHLYSPNPVDELVIDQLLIHLPESLRLMENQHDALSAPITLEKIIQHSQRSPSKAVQRATVCLTKS